jgi:hypothetical protein
MMLATSGLMVASACSLAFDTSELDQGCQTASGEKLCEGKCVRIADPAYGCRPGVCEPCALQNAVPQCIDGGCRVAACLTGFGCADCSKTLYVDPENCGECGKACASNKHCIGGACEQ